jgi:hypothetical protein
MIKISPQPHFYSFHRHLTMYFHVNWIDYSRPTIFTVGPRMMELHTYVHDVGQSHTYLTLFNKVAAVCATWLESGVSVISSVLVLRRVSYSKFDLVRWSIVGKFWLRGDLQPAFMAGYEPGIEMLDWLRPLVEIENNDVFFYLKSPSVDGSCPVR